MVKFSGTAALLPFACPTADEWNSHPTRQETKRDAENDWIKIHHRLRVSGGKLAAQSDAVAEPGKSCAWLENSGLRVRYLSWADRTCYPCRCEQLKCRVSATE
jgi:hypothetical protein